MPGADLHGVLFTRLGGIPRKLADMVLTPTELRITKHPDAIAHNIPGPSLVHDKTGTPTLVYKRNQWRHLPPQLEALLPPSNRDNPQRIILSKLLARTIDVRGMPIIEQEWRMLLFAGRNGIGHVDAFPSDEAAMAYYHRQQPQGESGQDSSALWCSFRRIAEATAKDDDEIETAKSRLILEFASCSSVSTWAFQSCAAVIDLPICWISAQITRHALSPSLMRSLRIASSQTPQTSRGSRPPCSQPFTHCAQV